MTKDEIKQLIRSFLTKIGWDVCVNFLNHSEAMIRICMIRIMVRRWAAISGHFQNTL